ncbi:MAG TPA: hypothetical protein VFM85_00460 [Actinomycetota bacterium]|nr:hypothetical protein [Actinomycetota bacterium]
MAATLGAIFYLAVLLGALVDPVVGDVIVWVALWSLAAAVIVGMMFRVIRRTS